MVHNAGQWCTTGVNGAQPSSVPLKLCTMYCSVGFTNPNGRADGHAKRYVIAKDYLPLYCMTLANTMVGTGPGVNFYPKGM